MRCCFKLLLILLLHHRLDLQRQTEQVDEARGILLIVNVVGVEGGEILAVESVGGGNARVDDVALIELDLYVAGDGLLSAAHKGGERLAQRREPLAEIGQFCEWNFERELDWFLLDYDMHAKLQKYMKDLNRFYREHPQMYERDTDWTGFEWLCVDDNYNNVLIFERKNGGNESVIAVCNFANVTHLNYCVAVDKGEFTLAFGSDDIMYGGSGVEVVRKPKAEDVPFKNKPATLILTIPANSVTYYLRKAEDK